MNRKECIESGGTTYQKFLWIGEKNPAIHQIKLDTYNEIVIGRYGGNKQAGAYKNEDGAMTGKGNDWEFAMILDGHNTAESVHLVVNTIENEWNTIVSMLDMSVEVALQLVKTHIISVFQSQDFLESCKQVQGETACLICVRKANYVWWLSIGDCLIYLLHEELHKLGQYVLNQRHFYEWIGDVNTFSLPIPCYSSGIKELRTGHNRIIMVTDGVLECGERYYENPVHLYTDCYAAPVSSDIEGSVQHVLQHVHKNFGRDSATIISWDYNNPLPATYPSNQPERRIKHV